MDPNQESSFSTQRYYSKSPPKGPRRMIIFVILLLIIAGAGFGVKEYIASSQKSTKEAKNSASLVTPTEEPLPTDTPIPTASVSATPTRAPTQKPTTTPTPKPTSNPVDKKTGLDRSSLTVDLLNGSGVVGAAAKASDLLKSLGYAIGTVGNADSYDYQNITIQVKSAKESYLQLLKQDLSSSYTIGTTSATLTASSSADAVVIVGK